MNHRTGRLEVICGSMFCGKTEELIRLIRRAMIAKQCVQVVKPSIDNRRGVSVVTSHNGQQIDAEPVEFASDILSILRSDTTVVAIDEVQFFDPNIVPVVDYLVGRNIRVIVAGLDTDFRGEPFGSLPLLMSVAEEVTKLHAICTVCAEEASRTQRIVNGVPAHVDDPVVLVGAAEAYEARCRQHHIVRRG